MASFRFLFWATGTAVVLGALGAYLLMCVIFYQNQAMMIFHPSPKITITPASAGLTYQEARFDPATDGQAQLTGWWVPAAKNAAYGKDTILYLHGATGSLSDSVPEIKALHALGVNIFAVDYRGFGSSAVTRPTEQTADSDVLAAWNYLTGERNLPAASIVFFGEGAGATFATHLAAQQKAAGLVLAKISPTAHTIFENDPRARLLPLVLLANQKMNPAPELQKLHTPKLFLDWTTKDSSKAQSETKHDFSLATQPKQIASLSGKFPAGMASAVQPFLAQVWQVCR